MILRTKAVTIIDGFKRIIGIGTPKTTGTPDVRAGEQVNIDGTGDRFSGSSEVDSVSHEVGDTSYDENFEVKQNDLTDK